MKTVYITLLSCLALAATTHAQLLISDFGTGDSIAGAVFDDTWSGTLSETTTNSTIGPSATDFGGFRLLEVLNLTGNDSFELTARLDANNTATSIIVTAFSGATDTASATFSTSSFNSSGFSSDTEAWTTSGSFNPASVIAWGISGGSPSSTTTFRVTFDKLQAIPEPTSFLLISLAGLAGVALRRRR